MTSPSVNAALGTTPSGIVRPVADVSCQGLSSMSRRIAAAIVPACRSESEKDERRDGEGDLSLTEKEGFEPSTQEFTHVTP